MQSIIEKFSTNFIVAAFIPSLAFVIGMVLIFSLIIPFPVSSTSVLGLENILLIVVCSAVIGFTLSSMNTFIYKTFEGYFLVHHFRFLQRRQQQQVERLQRALKRNEKQLERVEERLKKASTSRLVREKNERAQRILQNECYRLATELDSKYPPSKLILPTRFGNTLRAAEAYSANRYGIDGVPIWPRLIHVIPDKYYEKLEDNNNGLAFLLNCSTLSFAAAVLCLVGCGQQLYAGYCQANASGSALLCDLVRPGSVYPSGPIIYFFLSALMLVLFRGFYNAAVPAVGTYGDLVRSAYDLFRFDLLTALHLNHPLDSTEEYGLWEDISEFMTLGRPRGSKIFQYHASVKTSDEDNI